MKSYIFVWALALLVTIAIAREVNEDTLDLIKNAEGWYSCAYTCPAGKLTIGYGHLVEDSDDLTSESCINKERGKQLLKEDLTVACECIDDMTTVTLSDNEFGALVSWAFNVGCGRARRSDLIKALNQGKKKDVCKELKRFNKGGGKVLPGLVTRRQNECDLFKK